MLKQFQLIIYIDVMLNIGVVTRFVGGGSGTTPIWGSTDGVGTAGLLQGGAGIVISSAGILYLAESGNNVIRKILPDGNHSFSYRIHCLLLVFLMYLFQEL